MTASASGIGFDPGTRAVSWEAQTGGEMMVMHDPESKWMAPILDALGAAPGGRLVLRQLDVNDWGRTLRLHCTYQETSTTRAFLWTFSDCRELKWRVYVHDAPALEAVIVGVSLGRAGHRSPAQLLTDMFGLSLVYGEMSIA